MEDKRASPAAEIITPERPQQHRKEALAHVDAASTLPGPSAVPSATP
jgi:hypothetical protein